jgi:hypothetical protein
MIKGISAALALEARRDVVLHAYTRDWRLKAAFVSRTVAMAAQRHGLTEATEVQGLGRAMTAALVAADTKDEERVVVSVAGQGHETYAEALPAVGEVRGYARASPEREGQPRLARLSRVVYGAKEASSSTVEGEVEQLLRAQGLAALMWEGGGVVMEQSAQHPLELARRDALQVCSFFLFVSILKLRQDRLDAFGSPRAGELPSEYVARLAGPDESLRVSRVWTAFHCRCVLPTNARSFAQPGEKLTCHFCAKEHLVV